MQIGKLVFYFLLVASSFFNGLTLAVVFRHQVHSGLLMLIGFALSFIALNLLVISLMPALRRYAMVDDGIYCCECSYPLKGSRGSCSECGAEPAYWRDQPA